MGDEDTWGQKRRGGQGLWRIAALLTTTLGVGAGCVDYDAKVGPGTRPAGVADAAGSSGPPVGSVGSEDARGEQDAAPDGLEVGGELTLPGLEAGAMLFAERCASCHGVDGRGHTAIGLRPWPGERSALVDQIAVNMPPFAPEQCDVTCAERIADWLLSELPALQCDEPRLPPPRLRLLSRRELLATVRDLFDAPTEAADCGRHTFSYTHGGAAGSVVVAGSFNGWAATAAAGGWALTREGGSWRGTFEVGDGTWQYKFVVDGQTWVTDPGNPNRVDDGYGGQNSVLVKACAAPRPAVPPGDELVRSFPPEVRPHGFAFDTWSEQVVTSSHIESWLEAVTFIADGFVADLAKRLPCAAGVSGAGTTCARTFIETWAPKIYRRPVAALERDRLAALVTAEPSFSDGVRVALRVMLTAPDFVYRSELGTDGEDGVRRLTAYERASALSYGLWGTMPDEALMTAARLGRLDDAEGLASEARRMLGDPRAREAVASFVVSWLGADRVTSAVKNGGMFPGFGAEVRESLLAETRAFAAHVVFEGSGRFGELLTADYTFLNEASARHYGVGGVSGTTLRKVTAPAERRAGVLAHASVLATTAHSDQSSPILRGLFVRERLLCQTFGAPPPDAGGLPPVDPSATTRERFRQHTDNEVCASCHQYIDDLGFGFEHFDAVGRWRETDAGQPIDATGNLNDREGFGTQSEAPFGSLPELGALLADSPTARACFVSQVARQVFGAKEADRCELAELVARFERRGGDIKELLVDLMSSAAFSTRRASVSGGAGTP